MQVTSEAPIDEGGLVLRVESLSKTFVAQRVLDSVSLDVKAGEVHAIVGQNGSGKSTMVKILSGYHRADPGGRLWFAGEWHDAERLYNKTVPSLRFVHQDLGLVPTLSALENLLIGHASTGGPALRTRWHAEREQWRDRLAEFGLSIDMDAPVAELSPYQRTIVAVARAVSDWKQHPGALVLDESTAALPAKDAEGLFDAVRVAVSKPQAGAVFISHRLDEVMRFADRVSVLRDGRLVSTSRVSETDEPSIIEAMLGARAQHQARAGARPAAARLEPSAGRLLEVERLEGWGQQPLTLSLGPGETVGLTGLAGSGYERVCPLVFGAAERDGGHVRFRGEAIPEGDPKAAIAAGLGYIPRDRMHKALVAQLSARENLTLPRVRSGWIWRLGHGAEREEVAAWMGRVSMRPMEPERGMWSFSGGNQQKLVLARWLRLGAQALLLDEPTQGVDVGARALLYELLVQAARDGVAFLVASSDTEELAELCDRVLVFRDGRTTAELTGGDLTEERLLLAIQGEA